MTDRPRQSALLLELLTWIEERPRTYAEAIDAWRSSCPRHPVWDDAVAAGLVRVVREGRNQNESAVALTDVGRAALSR
jgi:hypothetical protein